MGGADGALLAGQGEVEHPPLQEGAAVATVQQTVTQFLTGRPGLGPRVQSAADTRTNTLIVYAAPRDMKEASQKDHSMLPSGVAGGVE